MKPAGRWLLLVVPLTLALLFGAAYLLVDAWLESAGGRQAVERELTERIGMPVRLEGEFHVVLLPAIGVSGTSLVVGQPGAATELARSEEYAVSLALAPLLDRRLLIESVRFANGVLYLERWRNQETSLASAPPTELRLPEIGRLEIRSVRIVAGAEAEEPYLLQDLTIEGFAAGRASPVRLEVQDYGAWAGSLSWHPERSALELAVVGTGYWPGEMRLRVSALLEAATGAAEAEWTGGSTEGRAVRLSLAYAMAPAGLRMSVVRLASDPLLIEGDGCLLTTGTPSLNLVLTSDRIDADALPDWSALSGPGQTEERQQPAGIHLNVRLAVEELLAGGAVARQAVLRLGGEPDCQMLGPVAAD